MWKPFLVGAVLSLVLAPASYGQAPQSAPPTMRITVTLVQVDAVVTDSHGRHIADLQPGDFEILQDGVAQKVTYFSYIPEDIRAAEAAPEPKPKRGDEKAPAGPPAPVAPSQIKRTVALVVDDLSLSFDNIVRVREGLKKFVEEQMQPGDLVALVRTGGGVAILEQFTTDKRVLLEAIGLLKWKFAGRTGLVAIDPVGPDGNPRAPGSKADPQYLDYGYTLTAMGALGTLEDVVNGMRKMPGRKSVVFFSESLRLDPSINSAIDRLTDLSNRSDVSVYTVDPSGLKTYAKAMMRDPHIPEPSPDALPELPPDFGSEDMQDSRYQDGLNNLARRTGGLFIADRNDIEGAIRTATDDQLGYYLLGYSPQEGTFENTRGKAKFHKIVVKVRRPGVQVRWKSGFEGVPDQLYSPETPTAVQRERQLLDALASPFTATGIKVRLTSLFTQTPSTGPVVVSMLHFDAKDLSFQHDADGMWTATVDVVTSAYRGVKQPMQQRQRHQQIRLTDEAYQKALKEGFLFNLVDKMKEPGMFLMRAVVRDMASERIGSASQYVQVPDTRKGQMAVSGIMLDLADPAALSAAGLTRQNGKVEPWSEGGPAVRRYRPGQDIEYGYMVIHPKLKGPAKEPQLTTQVRVFRNGKQIYRNSFEHSVVKSSVDALSYVGGGLLRLGTALTTGEYLLQVAVTDENSGRKKAHVAQWVDFEVTAAPATASPAN